jgi:hypothetical protein
MRAARQDRAALTGSAAPRISDQECHKKGLANENVNVNINTNIN